MSFLEEIWSRNLTNLFITPLKEYELVSSLIIISALRTLVGLTPAVFLANYFFNFHLFEMGFYLIFLLFFNLIAIGWSIGFIVSGLVLRYGHSFEELAWAIIFILLPFSCVYYPLITSSNNAKDFSTSSTSLRFESMRMILIEQIIDFKNLSKILLLNFLYLKFFNSLFYVDDKILKKTRNFNKSRRITKKSYILFFIIKVIVKK